MLISNLEYHAAESGQKKQQHIFIFDTYKFFSFSELIYT